jgi:hypothetical protein
MSQIQLFMEMREKEKNNAFKKKPIVHDKETQTLPIDDDIVLKEKNDSAKEKQKEEVDENYIGFESPNLLTRFYCHQYLLKKKK